MLLGGWGGGDLRGGQSSCAGLGCGGPRQSGRQQGSQKGGDVSRDLKSADHREPLKWADVRRANAGGARAPGTAQQPEAERGSVSSRGYAVGRGAPAKPSEV